MSYKSVDARKCDPFHVQFVRSFLAFAWLCLLVLPAGCSNSVKFADRTSSGPVVVLGDSLAAGYQLPEGQGFVDVLESRLGVEIENLSKSGITTTESLPRIKKEVLPLEPSLVIIELGGNDALQKKDVAETRANLQKMIDQVHEEKIPVMLLGVRGGLMSDKFEDMFEDLASDNEVAYVPNILDGLLTKPGLRIDNIHPNAKGHQLIADKVEPVLAELLQKIGIKK